MAVAVAVAAAAAAATAPRGKQAKQPSHPLHFLRQDLCSAERGNLPPRGRGRNEGRRNRPPKQLALGNTLCFTEVANFWMFDRNIRYFDEAGVHAGLVLCGGRRRRVWRGGRVPPATAT